VTHLKFDKETSHSPMGNAFRNRPPQDADCVLQISLVRRAYPLEDVLAMNLPIPVRLNRKLRGKETDRWPGVVHRRRTSFASSRK
jgi:hypothetical protein